MADNEELVSRMRHELDRDRPFDRALAEEAIEALSRDTESGWREVLRMAELYADFIRHHVKATDIEMHPYLPELESIIERAKQLPTPPKAQP